MDKDLNARPGTVKLPEEDRRGKLHGGGLGNDFLDITTVNLKFPLGSQAPRASAESFRPRGQADMIRHDFDPGLCCLQVV